MKRIISLLLCAVLLLGILPVEGYAEKPSAEGDTTLESTDIDYTLPVGATMQRLPQGVPELGQDLLFVVSYGGHYYAMLDVPAQGMAYDSIPAVDITDWFGADGSITVPADTRNVAFWRFREFDISAQRNMIDSSCACLSYSFSFVSGDGDDNHYNDYSRAYYGKFLVKDQSQYVSHERLDFMPNDEGMGTLVVDTSWTQMYNSYNYVTHKAYMIADLRDTADGGKEFYLRYLGTDVPYEGTEVRGYLYAGQCRHQYTVRYGAAVAPTCLCKGVEEYWYCEGCNLYWKDAAMTQCHGEEMPILAATGHDWSEAGCGNCGRPLPVYSKVTDQATFDALAEDTMYLLVAQYNGKYYTPDVADLLLYGVDSNGDGFRDIYDIDENENGISDMLEVDEDEDGVYDYLNCDWDGDGEISRQELLDYHQMQADNYLVDKLYASSANLPVKEIVPNEDGTFSHEAVKDGLEFEIMDVYTPELIEEMLQWGYGSESWWSEDYLYYFQCLKKMVIPNSFISAPSLVPVDRQFGSQDFTMGDVRPWAILFADNDYPVYDTWTDEVTSLEKHPVCGEGSLIAFSTYDYYWASNQDQLRPLRLRDYEDTLTFVSGEDWELEGSEYIYEEDRYDTHDIQVPIYLYASQQSDHTCRFENWTDSGDGENHTGTCTCGKTQSQPHTYEDGVCTACGREKTALLVLTEDTQVQLTLEEDLYVDLAGFELGGTIVAKNHKIYAVDSSTDDYTCENIGYFNCVDENGDPIVPERVTVAGEKQYLAIASAEGYSFHRFFVGVTHMSLAPETVGLGYKSAIFGDEMVFAELDTGNAFTFRVQLEGYQPVYRYFDRDELTSGDPITLRIRNYDVENYSEHKLYAQVSMTLRDGTVIEAEETELTFRWLTEEINKNYADYTAQQLESFKALLQAFEVVKNWDIPNLIGS